jgi:molybdopterin synthase catalytic subunit
MIRVQHEDFDPGRELDQLREQAGGQAGAVVSFIGLVRDLNAGERIEQMTLEHYPGMTEKALAGIEREARERWNLTGVVIIHRVGPLHPNDRIVLVAAASPHRRGHFRPAVPDRRLKTGAPFWKEIPRRARWVDTDNLLWRSRVTLTGEVATSPVYDPVPRGSNSLWLLLVPSMCKRSSVRHVGVRFLANKPLTPGRPSEMQHISTFTSF